MATNISAVLKSKKNSAIGRKTVDDPKPAMVPSTSEKNAATKKIISGSGIEMIFVN